MNNHELNLRIELRKDTKHNISQTINKNNETNTNCLVSTLNKQYHQWPKARR